MSPFVVIGDIKDNDFLTMTLDITWSQDASGFEDARYAILYKDSGAAATSPLIAYADLGGDKGNKAGERVGGISDWADRVMENLVRRPGTLIWDEMKQDADDAFASDGAGAVSLKIFVEELA